MPQFTADDGLRLNYEEDGSGPPLLCLAGLTRNVRDFEPVVDHFATRARVIRLDTRGRGASDFDPDFRNYTVQREGQDALNLLDHLGLDSVPILGTSRGGLIAMLLAITHKNRLSGVFLNDIGPVVDRDGIDFILGYLGQRPPYRDYDDAADRLPADKARDYANVDRATWRRFAERLWIEAPDGLDLRYDPALATAAKAQLDTEESPDLWPLYDALDGLPLAILRGANSDLLSRETVAEMRRRRPDALFAEVADRGHVPFLDEPESLDLIDRFLESLT